MDQWRIKLGSAICQPADFMLAGNPYQVLVTRKRGVKGGKNGGRLVILRDSQVLAARVGDSASAQEMKPALVSHPVANRVENMVFQSSGRYQVLHHTHGSFRPVGGQHNQIGS
jgi:hypothetical protein